MLAVLVASPALPTPFETIPDIADNIYSIVPQFGISLYRIAVSMLIGTAIGAPIGLAMGRSKFGDRYITPIFYILYPVPKIVFLPVLFVLFGLGGEAKIILISIAVFFQMVVTMRDSAYNIDGSLIASMRSLGASRIQIFFSVVVPATLPSLFNGLRITTGTAVAILFISEWMAGSSGLGYFIMHAWSLLEYSKMFAGIVAMGIMGVLLYETFDILEKRFSKAGF